MTMRFKHMPRATMTVEERLAVIESAIEEMLFSLEIAIKYSRLAALGAGLREEVVKIEAEITKHKPIG